MFTARICLSGAFVILICGSAIAESPWYLPPRVFNEGDAPCAWVKQGKVCGDVIQTREKRSIAAYKGIPYAKPPVGNLRFKVIKKIFKYFHFSYARKLIMVSTKIFLIYVNFLFVYV